MIPRSQRIINVALIIGLVVALIGGAFLFALGNQTAATNSAFICSFGSALNKAPIHRRADETPAEFRKRVALTREFVADLNRIQECDPPARVRIGPRSRPALEENREGSQGHSESAMSPESDQEPGGSGNLEGGGSSDMGSTPSSPPTPPAGGGGNGGGGGPEPVPPDPPVGNPPTTPPPDDPPGLLDAVTDQLPLDCEINLAGVRVCS